MKKSHIITFLFIIFCLLRINVQAQIPFELNANGHILIKAKINGVEGKFIFDTGAGLNVVFTKFSKKIENQKTNNFFVGHRATGEELSLDLYNATSMEINNKIFNNQQYSIVDLDFGDIDGLISLQPFRNTPVTIDYVHKTIFFNKKTKKEKSIDIQISDHAGKSLDIFTFVKLNDTLTIQVELDSGSGANSYWFSSKFMEYLALNKTDFKIKPIKGEFNKENNFYIGKLRKLEIQNVSTLDTINVAFVDGLIHEGKTGIDWLGKILTIDLAKKKIFIAE